MATFYRHLIPSEPGKKGNANTTILANSVIYGGDEQSKIPMASHLWCAGSPKPVATKNTKKVKSGKYKVESLPAFGVVLSKYKNSWGFDCRAYRENSSTHLLIKSSTIQIFTIPISN